MTAAVQEILKGHPGDEILTTAKDDYYNNSHPSFKEVVDIVKDSDKIIILTDN